MSDQSSALSETIRTLVREKLRSLEEVECVLLLYGEPRRGWSQQDVAAALHINEDDARTALNALAANGLATSAHDGFRYAPNHDAAVEALNQAYPESRVEVLMEISSNAITRVRKGIWHVFAKAFRTTDKKEG